MDWFEIVLACIMLYIAASLRIVGPTELGCILRFGKPLKNVSSGLVFAPLWIFTLETETKLVIQDELPTEPEKIYRGSERDPEGSTVPPELAALGFIRRFESPSVVVTKLSVPQKASMRTTPTTVA